MISPDGNRVLLLDGDGNLTTWAYDSLNRVTGETNPLNAAETYAYDAEDRRNSVTDRDGQRPDLTFDADGRVLTEKWFAVGGAKAVGSQNC